jgi:hypothetical protein
MVETDFGLSLRKGILLQQLTYRCNDLAMLPVILVGVEEMVCDVPAVPLI